MEQPQDQTPPSFPPPMPVKPLSYATPVYNVPQPSGRFHQAAKASWVAPIIAVALSCLSRGAAKEPNEMSGFFVIQIAMAALIVGGLICGIIALCGVKRAGSGVLAPAIVGVAFNTIILLAALTLFTRLGASPSVSRGVPAAAPRVPAPVTSPQSALRQTGWVGALNTSQYRVTIFAFAEGHPDTLDLLSQFSTPCSALIISADNRNGTASYTVSADGAVLHFADGKFVPALRTRDVLSSATRDAANWNARFGSPFTVHVGETIDARMLFIPPGLDLTKLESISLTVDGRPQLLKGKIVTAEEKTAAMNGSAQK